MNNIININNNDPFKDIDKNVDNSIIHLRLQQRNKTKCITIIEGLIESEELSLKKLAKSLRKLLNCSASIINKDNDDDKIIQLSGDKRKDIAEYLIKLKIVDKKYIKIHGY